VSAAVRPDHDAAEEAGDDPEPASQTRARPHRGGPDGRARWRIDKANRSGKIDAAIALAMAVDTSENQPEPARVIGLL
jgi:hypothetical protein